MTGPYDEILYSRFLEVVDVLRDFAKTQAMGDPSLTSRPEIKRLIDAKDAADWFKAPRNKLKVNI